MQPSRCFQTKRISGPCGLCGRREAVMHFVDASGIYCGKCCRACAIQRYATAL